VLVIVIGGHRPPLQNLAFNLLIEPVESV